MTQFVSINQTYSIVNEINPSNSPAVKHDGQSISYVQFCHATSQLARRLGELELNRSVPVAIVMERGFGLYTSQFGVLASGGFFLPVDPANPDERIQFLLSDSRAECVIVDPETALKISSWQLNLKLIEVDPASIVTDSPDIETTAPIVFPHADEDPAYMIYTSGSTGKPKGVCIHWEAICNHDRWFIEEFQIVPQDRCLQIASIGFDISIEEIFTTIRSGACLVSINKQALDSPAEFFRWVEQEKLSVLNMPTALWHNVVPALSTATLSDSVRVLIIGGEQVKPDLVETWFQHIPPDQVRLVNGYGPTETTITATVCNLTPETLQAIGRPVKNLQCHIIGEDDQIIESYNTPGELYISGVGVAKGYWNRPEQTAKAFMTSEVLGGKWCYRTGDKVQRDEDGQLHFLGRIDNQVKLRGYRIELQEIENAIGKHPQISNAVVRKTTVGREHLVCFATPVQTAVTNIDVNGLQQELAGFLKQTLPPYMVPSRFQFLDKFPVTVGGKIDTDQLMSMVAVNGSPAIAEMEGLDELQTQIIQVWESVLGNPPESVETTFEECGGDSLAAMALAVGLEKAFPERKFGVATLLTHPTVSRLADYATEAQPETDFHDTEHGSTPIINSLGRPLDAQTPCLIFLHPGGGSGYLYNQLLSEKVKQTWSILILDSPWLTGELPGDDHQETTTTIAQRYAKVLARSVVPGTRITTAGYSFGGILAFETARYLKESGFNVDQVINIDQPIPQAIEIGSLSNRLKNWLHRLKSPQLAWQELNYSREKKALQAGEKTNFSSPHEMLRSFDLEDIHATIEDAYLPQHCDLEMNLIRGDIMEAKYLIAEDYGWQKYTRSLTVDRVSGTHFTLFMGHNLEKLALRFLGLLKSL